AREEARGYAARRAELETMSAAIDQVRSNEVAVREQVADLRLLEKMWARLDTARQAEQCLARLPAPGEDERQLLAARARVNDALTGWSGHLERTGTLADLRQRREKLDVSIAAGLRELWEGATEDEVLLVHRDAATLGELREHKDSVVGLEARLADAKRAADDAKDRAGVVAEQAPLPGEEGRSLPSLDDLDQHLRSLGELRKCLAERQSLSALVDRDDQAAAAAAAARGTEGSWPRAAAILAVLSALAAAGSAASAAAGAARAVAVVLAVVAVVLVGAAIVLARAAARGPDGRALAGSGRPGGTDLLSRSRRRPVDTEAPEAATATTNAAGWAPPTTEPERRRRRLREIDLSVSRLAGELGLANEPGATEVEATDKVLRDSRERRLQLDGWRKECAAATAEADSATETVQALEAGLDAEQARFAAWRAAAGLPATVGWGVAAEVIEAARSLADKADGRTRLDQDIEARQSVVEEFEDLMARLARDLGRQLPSAPEPRSAWLGSLSSELGEIDRADRERKELQSTIRQARDEVETELGKGAKADGLRKELDSGRVIEWRRRAETLTEDLDRLGREVEEAVRRHESARGQLDELLGSERIAALQSSVAGLETELDAVLRSYLVLSSARGLLASTLALHERERQPAVLLRAGRLFGAATNGRYDRVVVAGDESELPSICVVSSSGETIDAVQLSRGTREQLYLSLRLGLAEEFSDRSVALPIVLDDVLVNFDAERARAVVCTLVEVGRRRQVLLFTCHPHLVRLARNVEPGLQVVSLGAPVVSPDAPVVSPDVPVVSPDVPVVSPDVPVVSPDVPVVSPDYAESQA
ncbi:MAG: ATP-binding protein, partial [Acidimicrobiales bacterium]